MYLGKISTLYSLSIYDKDDALCHLTVEHLFSAIMEYSPDPGNWWKVECTRISWKIHKIGQTYSTSDIRSNDYR